MYEKQISEIKQITEFTPEIGIVLGSGLGELADKIKKVAVVPYSAVTDMPISTAPTHSGQFVFGYIGTKKAVLMQGRVHLYEGYTPQQVVMPIILMKMLGISKLILTNASGGINKDFKVGDFMMITDHISCFVPSPLIGNNPEELGTRFPNMSNAYDKDLQAVIKKTAFENGIELKSGVYTQLTGPQFETAAEIKMLSGIGSDAVGMSTAIEAIAANHCGLKVCGISLITNLACGILDKPISGEEVSETASRVAPIFQKLIIEIAKAV